MKQYCNGAKNRDRIRGQFFKSVFLETLKYALKFFENHSYKNTHNFKRSISIIPLNHNFVLQPLLFKGLLLFWDFYSKFTDPIGVQQIYEKFLQVIAHYCNILHRIELIIFLLFCKFLSNFHVPVKTNR